MPLDAAVVVPGRAAVLPGVAGVGGAVILIHLVL